MVQGGGKHGNLHDVRQVIRCVSADMARNSAKVMGTEEGNHEHVRIRKTARWYPEVNTYPLRIPDSHKKLPKVVASMAITMMIGNVLKFVCGQVVRNLARVMATTMAHMTNRSGTIKTCDNEPRIGDTLRSTRKCSKVTLLYKELNKKKSNGQIQFFPSGRHPFANPRLK